MKITMPIAKAEVLAEHSGIEELVEAVAEAIAAGWTVVNFEEVDGDVLVTPHTGIMVAWMLPEFLAEQMHVEGGEQDLHITLAYLGDVEDMPLEKQRELVGVVSEVLADQEPLYGVLQGTGTFPTPEDGDVYPWFAEVNVPGLAELREKLVVALLKAGLPVNTDHPDYHPHMTLAYIHDGAEPPAVDVPGMRINIDNLTVAVAGSRHTIEMGERPDWSDEAWKEREAWFREVLGTSGEGDWPADNPGFRPFIKSVVAAEDRFTLGPWYIPNMEDAHGEWTDATELQHAAWRYVDTNYRSIHLQHMPDVIAGRWVEIMTLPHATTWPVIDPNGNVTAHEYPAGTVMLGVIWDQWAWELVKTGAITGYSIGGYSARVDEDVPGDDDAPAGTAAPAESILA